MHELSIVEALVEQAQKGLKRSGHEGRIIRLDLIIGRLSGVSSDSIRFACDLLSSNTPLEGAEIHISEPGATCRCRACDAQIEIDELAWQCPQCSSGDVSIEGGRELLLQSIEIED